MSKSHFKKLHQFAEKGLQVFHAGVSGVAGAAGVGKGRLGQEGEVFLPDGLQLGGDAHVGRELLDRVDGGPAVLVLGHSVHPFDPHGPGDLPVLFAGAGGVVLHDDGEHRKPVNYKVVSARSRHILEKN